MDKRCEYSLKEEIKTGLVVVLFFFIFIFFSTSNSYSQEYYRYYLNDESSNAYATLIRQFEFVCPRAAYRDVFHNYDDFAVYRIECVKRDGRGFTPPKFYRFELNVNKDTVLVKPWIE